MRHPYNAIQNRHQRSAPVRRVTWTDDENQLVALASFDIRTMDPSLSNMEAVRRAQVDVLSPERHRKIRQEKDIEREILPIWKTLKGERNHASDAPPAPLTDGDAQQAVEALTDAALRSPHIDPMESINGPAADTKQIDFVIAAPETVTLTEAKPAPRKLVRWSHDEQLAVARESKRLLSGFEDMSRLEAVRKAVTYALPPERQRKINTMSEVQDWIAPLWQQVETEQRAADAERERAAGQVRHEAEAREREAQNDPRNLSLETLIATAVTKIVDQLAATIGERLQDAIMRRVVETLQHTPVDPAAIPEGTKRLHIVPRDHKPRVTVVGLLNQQADDVRRAFDDVIDFTFIKSQQQGGSGAHGGAGVLSRGAHADVVIQMSDFTGHDVDAASKHLTVPFVRVPGSVSALKRWLRQWLNGEVALAASA